MPGPQHKPATYHPDSTQADGHRAAATAGHQAAPAGAAAGHQAAQADGRRAARRVAQLHGRQQATRAGIKHHSPKWMAATVGRS